MTPPQFQVNYLLDSDYEPFERGAKLIALLAFPDSTEVDLRQRAFEALCAQTVHATCAADLANSSEWRARFS
jgi:hypothetical protein